MTIRLPSNRSRRSCRQERSSWQYFSSPSRSQLPRNLVGPQCLRLEPVFLVLQLGQGLLLEMVSVTVVLLVEAFGSIENEARDVLAAEDRKRLVNSILGRAVCPYDH